MMRFLLSLFCVLSLLFFTINAYGQTLTSIDQDSGYVREYQDLKVIGNGFGLTNTQLNAKLIQGGTVINASWSNIYTANSFVARFYFPIGTPTGLYDLSFTNSSSQTIVFPGVFTMLAMPPINLVSPLNHQIFSSSNISYTWTSSPAAEYYRLDISRDSAFSSFIHFNVYDTTATLPNFSYLNGKTYWRVSEMFSNSPVYISQANDFTVQTTPSLTSINPNTAYGGQNLQLELSGVNLHFQQASSTLGLELKKGNYSISATPVLGVYNSGNSESNFHFNLSVPFGCPTGFYDVVTHNTIDDTLIIQNGFYIRAGNSISGLVYYDLNQNQIFDTGDVRCNNAIVGDTTYRFLASTNGVYSGYVPSGSYQFSVLNYVSYFISNPPFYSLNWPPLNTVVTGKDFALQGVPGAHDVAINIGASRPFIRPGFPIDFTITLQNIGPGIESGTLKYLPPSGLTFTSISDSSFTTSGDTLLWNYSNLTPFQSIQIISSWHGPLSLQLGQMIHSEAFAVNNDSDFTPGNNFVSLSQSVANSYDPNYKISIPESLTPNSVLNGDGFEYTIYFQNTGNDTAYHVRVFDTLSTDIDINSFKFVSASHVCNPHIYEDRLLVFDFPNINLLDSATNEELSHGYVTFRVKAIPTLVEGDEIYNTAYIYFDANPAIVTNNLITPIKKIVIPVPAIPTEGDLSVSPNPVANKSVINYSVVNPGEVKINLISSQGKIVRTLVDQTQATGKYSIDFYASELAAGTYVLSMQSADGEFRVLLVRSR